MMAPQEWVKCFRDWNTTDRNNKLAPVVAPFLDRMEPMDTPRVRNDGAHQWRSVVADSGVISPLCAPWRNDVSHVEVTQPDNEDGGSHPPQYPQAQTEPNCPAQLEEWEACSEDGDGAREDRAQGKAKQKYVVLVTDLLEGKLEKLSVRRINADAKVHVF